MRYSEKLLLSLKLKDICSPPPFFNVLSTCMKYLKTVIKLKYTLKKITQLKITQLEKVHFIKVNELKLTQVELFYIFHPFSKY